nr:DivIVA domain-containing protein [Dissulfurimicrobium hydrothermale]
MGVTPNEILEKEFKMRFRGYDPSEVQDFLEEVAAELTEVIKERNALKGYVAGYKAKLDEFKKKEDEFMSALTTANKLAEDMKAQAAKEAGLILERARMDAERIVADAHHEAVQLEERIRRLRRMQREVVSKIRSSIEGYLRFLDEEALPPQEVDEVLRDIASEVRAVQSNGEGDQKDATEADSSAKVAGVAKLVSAADKGETGARLVEGDILGDEDSKIFS